MKQKTKTLTTSAMLIALAVVLDLVSKMFGMNWPYGGSITLAAMSPIIIAALLSPTKWGLVTAFTYSLLQIVLGGGIMTPPTETIGWFIAVLFLDYILAFTVLGLAGFFFDIYSKKLSNRISIAFAGGTVIFLRFICHFISGILIWGCYAPEGQSAVVYSLFYNGAYMLGDGVIAVAVLIFLSKFIMTQRSE